MDPPNGVSWADAVTAASSAATAITAIIAGFLVWRQLRTLRQTNAMSVLVDLLERHQAELAGARRTVFSEIPQIARSELRQRGLDAIPRKHRDDIINLAWFYDHVGLLVAQRLVDIEPIAGYLGDSVITNWELLEPLIVGERRRRRNDIDPNRWQWYFENLYHLVLRCPPARARLRGATWIDDAPTSRPASLTGALRRRRMARLYGPPIRTGSWLETKRRQFAGERLPWAAEHRPPHGSGPLRTLLRQRRVPH